MRDILSENKSFLKQNDVNRMEVPCYQEISVKNLYEDAMKDELLVKYLPTKEQLSGRLPERGFFFGAMHFEARVHEGDNCRCAEGKVHDK